MYNTISDTVQCLCCVSPRKPLASQDLIFVEGKSISDVDNPEDSIARVAYNTVILNQTFDDEQIGDAPKNWTITQPQYGSFTIDNQTCYSGGRQQSLWIIQPLAPRAPTEPFDRKTEQ